MGKYTSPYKNSLWFEFRESVIELDGYKCSVCGRGRDEVILQVHHLKYIAGRKPWEYATHQCKTLCKSCHASEHGIIMPKFGWEYIGDEDLGDLIGTCDNCGSSLRYLFYIFHENWGTVGVGTHCCDILTDSNIASNLIESQKRYDERKKRFLISKRWKETDHILKIKQGVFKIEIKRHNSTYCLKINQLESKKVYKSIEDAQSKVFDIIESGELIDYFKKHGVPLENNKKINK
ncbi:conserved hypothetical protein [uncultured Dysgonomonas sp.]|uniref:HNH domain-containing protein n=1 Tax=uncultured Dysgonomonas sp. TaxID=206096 RepID=A0A212K0X7_9BACT|nr:HNH endonuclease signature motif containing protein [uncultured Dysgonomonas sp.]SBW05306.1 conserved hypothetical protein [uncultured Dysgonomonas sp.]